MLPRHGGRPDCLVLIIVMGVIAAANLHREGVRTHLSGQVENNGSQKGPICDCNMTKTPTKALLAVPFFFTDKCLSQLFLWDLRLLKFIFHTLECASTCMKCIFIFSIQNIYFKCQSKHRCQHNQRYIAQFKKKTKNKSWKSWFQSIRRDVSVYSVEVDVPQRHGNYVSMHLKQNILIQCK